MEAEGEEAEEKEAASRGLRQARRARIGSLETELRALEEPAARRVPIIGPQQAA